MGADKDNKKSKKKEEKHKDKGSSKADKQKKKDKRKAKEAKRVARETEAESHGHPSYVLTYFRSGGNAQASRLAYEETFSLFSGVLSADVSFRLAAAGADWSNHYVDGDTWPAVKSSGLAPFGQVPFLEVRHADGSSYVMAQGHAIVRHVAREFGFDGANEYERCIADSLLERLSDMKGSFGRAYFGAPEEERKTRAAAWIEKEWPVFSAELDRFISRNASSFLVGPRFTGADLAWFATLSSFATYGIADATLLTKMQKQFLEAVRGIPGVAAFLKSDKNPEHKN